MPFGTSPWPLLSYKVRCQPYAEWLARVYQSVAHVKRCEEKPCWYGMLDRCHVMKEH